MHFHSKQSIKILHRFTSTPSKQYKSYTDSFPLQASNASYPTQSTVIIHWLCYCTAVSMLSFLPVIVCGLLELKRICVGFLLIVWHGNESVTLRLLRFLLSPQTKFGDLLFLHRFLLLSPQTKFWGLLVFAPFLFIIIRCESV
jgi:hypothetical protein